MNTMRTSRGFTLIETILYLALVMIMLGAILPLSLQILNSGAKSGTSQEVSSSARYTSERIEYEIRNASSVNVGSSSFGVNLAASSTAMLSLIGSTSSVNPTKFSVVSGTLQITQGTSSAIGLNPTTTKVTSLIFSNYSTGSFNNIGFVMVLNGASTSTRTEYQATTTIAASAETRSK